MLNIMLSYYSVVIVFQKVLLRVFYFQHTPIHTENLTWGGEKQSSPATHTFNGDRAHRIVITYYRRSSVWFRVPNQNIGPCRC